jgi:two-component system sensor histidine kinase RegB
LANVRPFNPAALTPLALDKAGAGPTQAAPGFADEVRRSHLRVRTLVGLRWLMIAGEGLLLGLAFLLDFHAPYLACACVIGVAAWINLLTGITTPNRRVLGDAEATAHLTLEVIQITLLVYLTGGAANPFMLMLIAPVTLAAATLPFRSVAALGVLAGAAALTLAFVFMPLPATPGMSAMHESYRIAASLAVISGVALIAGYVRMAATESSRMALALDVTQAVLAREQRLSALGALAAAAAHELGTPLATITIVAKEMGREAPTAQVREDADLLTAQAQRCRDILRRLTETPAEATDAVHERMSLRQLLQEVTEPHAQVKGIRVEAIVSGAPGVKTPSIHRLPEIAHALTSFVENAVDFAASEVLVTARFDATHLSMEVRDDGPGFAPDILAKLGEPYVTSRPGAEGSRTGHVGMGLGFFISKTLLERTGAVVTFQNGKPKGAVVSARWPRDRIEAEPT